MAANIYHFVRSFLNPIPQTVYVEKSDAMKAKKKNIFIAYLLWLLGGISGMHLFYLGRDLHGFLYWCTFGGYLGFGWIRDFFHISEYVAEANNDPEYKKKLKETIKKNKKPPFSVIRFTGMVLLAYYWGGLYHIAIPEEEIGGINWKWLYMFTPIACALGVWAVGNVGNQKGGLTSPILAAYLTLPAKYITDEATAFTVMVLAAAYSFDSFEKAWRPKRKNKGILKRIGILFTGYLLFCSLFCSYLYFNAKITDQDGEEIPIRDAFQHFTKSSWWMDFKQSLRDVYMYAREHGWQETWKQMVDMTDPFGENNAYTVLELSSGASQSEINSKCRFLSVKYHPDKFKDEEEKEKAQEKFYEVQQACELLSSSRVKRRRRNKKFEENEEL